MKYIKRLEGKGLIDSRPTFVVTKNGSLMFTIASTKNVTNVYYFHQLWVKNDVPYVKKQESKKRNDL